MRWLLTIPLLCSIAFGSATTVFVTQNGAGTKDGTTLGNAGNCDAVANTPQSTCAFFNNAANWGAGSAQIGQDTTVIASGTITASPGAGGYMNFQASGASGHPITLQITGTLQSTHWAANGGGSGCLGGGVCVSSRSFVTIDGAGTGIIQNTDNGSSLGSQVASVAIDGYSCTSCSLTNIAVNNIYVNVQGNNTIGDSSIVRCMEINGSGWTIDHFTSHDSGWCIVDFFANGDANLTISNSAISNMGHGLALATSGTNAFTNLFFFNNDIGATANWSATGCFSHQDGIHMFGVTGSSIDDVFVSNNYFHGDWGTCPTGFVFVEAAGSGTPSNLKNSFWWNNVMIVNPGAAPDTSGWFELAQGSSGVQKVINNVMIGANDGTGGDNTACMVLQNLSGLTYENNVVSNCGDPITISSSTLVAVDHNVYGPSCQNGGNCFVWNGSFKGSFAAWKTACSCDGTVSIQTNTPLVNSDGSPQAGSPVIGIGLNLSTTATGNLATLQNDTTKGGSRSTIARPTGATTWAIGAYQFTSVTLPPPAPCANCFASVPEISPGKDSAAVTWNTVMPTIATLRYGLGTGYGKKIIETSGFIFDHAFEIERLKPSTTYHLELEGEDQIGNTIITPDKVFETP